MGRPRHEKEGQPYWDFKDTWVWLIGEQLSNM